MTLRYRPGRLASLLALPSLALGMADALADPGSRPENPAILARPAKVEVTDLTGTQNHYQARVVSPAFVGRTMIEQHRMVYDLLREEMASNEVHALTLKTAASEKSS